MDEISLLTLNLAKKYTDEHGGGGGTTDYDDLDNLPEINSVELKGNKSLSDLGIASAQAVSNITNGESINNFAGVETALSNVQSLDGVVDPSGSVGEDKNLYMKLSGSLPSAMKVTSLKFEVTARRGGGSGMIEYSRLGFYDADGNKYSWPQGTTWSSNVRTAENDPIGSSKMLQYEIPAITTINLPGGEYIDTSVYKLYGWNTGNDTIDHGYRDPVSWKLYLSEDKTNYILRDVRSNQTITTDRNTLAFKDEFNILPPGLPSISDIFYKKGGVWLKEAFAQQSEVDAIKDGQSIDSFADVETALDGVETALATKQNATDNNLDTDAKTIVGAINEHEGDIDSLKSGFTALDNEVNGDAVTYPYADVITVEDAVPANLADCSVKVEPVQDLHGQSAPYVGGAGKNKLPMTVDGIKAANTDGTWSGNTYTLNNVTFDLQTDDGENITGIKVNGTANAVTSFFVTGYGKFLTAGTNYALNGCMSGASDTYKLDLLTSTVAITTSTTGDGDHTPFTITNSVDYRARITVYSGVNVSNQMFYPMIRLATETDATFAPYTNICPISGHTEAVVTRDGKNRLSVNSYSGSGSWLSSTTIAVTGNYLYRRANFTTTGGAYTFSVYGIKNGVETAIDISANDGDLSRYNDVSAYDYVRVRGYSNNASNVLSDVMLCFNDNNTDTIAYEPYKGQQYTLDLGDTIYGGTVRIDSNGNTVMDVDRATVEYDGSEDESWLLDDSGANYFFYIELTGRDITKSVDANNCASATIGKTTTDLGVGTDARYLRYRYANDNSLTVSDLKTFLASNNLQVCYYIATPTTIQLTPQQIQLLKGTNTLTASTGQISVTVNGVSGAIGAVQEQVNELAEDVADVQSKQMVKTSETVTLNTNGVSRLTLTFSNGRLIYAVVISTTATYLALPYITSDKTWAVKVVDPTDMSPIASEEVEIGYGYIPN